MGVAAAIALMSCALSRGYAIPAALCILGYSAWRCCKDLQRPACQLLVPPAPSPVLVDGEQATNVELLERGPLLMLRWKAKSRSDSCVFWPDILNCAQRRELRLAVRARAVSRDAPTVAP